MLHTTRLSFLHTCRRLVLLGLTLSILSGCALFQEDTDPTKGWSANKLYTTAKESLDEGNYEQAVKFYEKLEARYPYGTYAQQAQIETAYAHYKANEPAPAIAACDRFIKLHPNHPNLDYVYYLKGMIGFNEDLGYGGYVMQQDPTERDPKSMRESFIAFKYLYDNFPNSKYRDDGAKRMIWLVNALASHDLHVANYYVRRGAWLAAANRAQDVVRYYPDAPAVEEALAVMSYSYGQLGLPDLQNDSDRILKMNYPNSRFLTEGIQRSKSWYQLY